jgi:hypothetical protein
MGVHIHGEGWRGRGVRQRLFDRGDPAFKACHPGRVL